MKISALKEKILSRIQSSGPMTCYEFIKLCLYDKEFGYYTKPDRIGIKGDYVTSSHCSPLFSRLIANQLIELWELLKENDFVLVEMGAGAGFLAKDILGYLKKKSIYERIEYVIVEQNPAAREVYKESLADFSNKIMWTDSLEALDSFKGCIFSNELLDAFPVHVMQKDSNEFHEIYIDAHKGEFVEIIGPLSSDLLMDYVANKIPSDLPNGYRTDVNLDIKPWLSDIFEHMTRGFVLTIDYGHTAMEFFNPVRNRGTLMCYKAHRTSEDFLAFPGEQDITAHVNFSDLHHAGVELGFCTLGYAQQWAFLGALDFEKTLKETYPNITPFSSEMAGVKMLIFPQGMGLSHKVMLQAKDVNINGKIKGFSLQNKMNKL